jgi:hypothetical protein
MKVAGLAVCGALACACGASSNPSPTLAQACGDYARSYCHVLSQCSPVELGVYWGDEATCIDRNALSCSLVLVPNVFASATEVESCARGYAGWSCDPPANESAVPAGCQPNTLADGGACIFDWQCNGASYCAGGTGKTCGVCAPRPSPKAGEPCPIVNGQQRCWDGSQGIDWLCCGPKQTPAHGCSGGPGATCQALPNIGESCAFVSSALLAWGDGPTCGSLPAGDQLDCVGRPGGFGKCMPEETKVGAACDPTLESGPGCSTYRSLTCNAATKTCQLISILPPGSSCSQGGQCGAGSLCIGQTCQPALADGAPCTPEAFPACQEPARCQTATADSGSGVCTLPSPSQSCR